MRVARIAASLCAALPIGCADGTVVGNAQTANMVREGSSQPPPVTELPPPLRGSTVPPRLEPLGLDEIEAAGLQGAGCDFTIGEQVLLVAVQDRAIARVGGRIIPLFHAGPLGGTGGFFGSYELRISVGRIEGAEETRDEGSSWPARIAVTTPWAGQPSRLEGRWSCGS